MSFFDDFKTVNKITLGQTVSGIKRNWYIIGSAGFVYSLLLYMFTLVSGFILRGPFSILAGIVNTLVMSSLISNFLVLIQLTVLNRKITFDNFKEGFKYYVWKIYGVFFILYIINYLASILAGILNTNRGLLSLLIYISFFVLFNALPEAIYLKDYVPMDTIKYTLGFMKDNWVQWAIPNILIFLVLSIASKGLTGLILSGVSLSGPVSTLKVLLRTFIVQILVGVFMVYRGNLFYVLSNSTKRNRMYKFGRK